MMLKLLKKYGIFGFTRLIRDILFTKVFFNKNCRIVRTPFYIRNEGTIEYGKSFTCGVGLRLDVFDNGTIKIGDNIQVNDYVHIACISNISIGKDTLIASKVFITDHNHGYFSIPDKASAPDTVPALRPLESFPVEIGERVWIGENVTILPGAVIGDGVIIAAGSVVRGNIPRDVIIAGVPAKIIKKYNFERNQWCRTQ